MKILQFIVRMLFNKRQRQIIWQSLCNSESQYLNSGDVSNAAATKVVMNEISSKLGMIVKTYTEEEFQAIVKNLLNKFNRELDTAYKTGFERGVLSSKDISTLEVGTVIDSAKCKSCRIKDDCITFQAVSEDAGNNETAE